MTSMSIEETGFQFSVLMNKVRNGEEIILYEGDHPVAVMKPYTSPQASLEEVLNRVSVNMPDFRFDREEANLR